METWYIVYKFGYSDTDSAIIEFDGEPDANDVADILDIDADKIILIRRKGE